VTIGQRAVVIGAGVMKRAQLFHQRDGAGIAGLDIADQRVPAQRVPGVVAGRAGSLEGIAVALGLGGKEEAELGLGITGTIYILVSICAVALVPVEKNRRWGLACLGQLSYSSRQKSDRWRDRP